MTVVAKEMVVNTNVACELRGRVVVGEVNAWFVVLIHRDGLPYELTRNALDHIGDPQQDFDDVGQRHVLGFGRAGRNGRLQHAAKSDKTAAQVDKVACTRTTRCLSTGPIRVYVSREIPWISKTFVGRGVQQAVVLCQ